MSTVSLGRRDLTPSTSGSWSRPLKSRLLLSSFHSHLRSLPTRSVSSFLPGRTHFHTPTSTFPLPSVFRDPEGAAQTGDVYGPPYPSLYSRSDGSVANGRRRSSLGLRVLVAILGSHKSVHTTVSAGPLRVVSKCRHPPVRRPCPIHRDFGRGRWGFPVGPGFPSDSPSPWVFLSVPLRSCPFLSPFLWSTAPPSFP